MTRSAAAVLRAALSGGALVAIIVAQPCAGAVPQNATGRPDPRIRVIPYDPDRVVLVDAAFGFQMMIQFSGDEHIQNVSVGDGSAWQVTPNKAATLLFIKPVDVASRTNMTVITDRRSYLFELNAHQSAGAGAASAYLDPAYVLRFTYPADKKDAQPDPPPERRNTAYSFAGSRATLPSVVFDDGRFTYFRWPDQVSVPALFLVSADGAESLVNYSVRDGFQVVEQVAPRFVLRNGKDVTVIINEAWREPAPAAGSPRPADGREAHAADKILGRAPK